MGKVTSREDSPSGISGGLLTGGKFRRGHLSVGANRGGQRIKKIKALILILQQRESLGQMGIEGIDAVEITPELKKLIYNPVGDLS